ALLNSRPPLDKRLKKLMTIKDFLDNSFTTEIISEREREQKHKKLYSKPPLLEIMNVEKEYFSNASFFGKTTSTKAVDDVSFKVFEGETLGLVGESGCGKSTLANAILQLDKATSGSIKYKGEELTELSGSQFRALRKEIQIIFQDPYSSLNPRIPVGKAIMEPMKVHGLWHSNK